MKNTILGKVKKAIVGLAASIAVPLSALAYVPPATIELDDVPGDFPIVTNVQDFVENYTSISNGVLVVGDQEINISQPSHTVITTNGTEIVTNTYYVVYEDGLSNTLTNYATMVRTTITTNGTEVVTNSTSVAYLDDIPPDDKKADKVIELWDFYCPQIDDVLVRTLRQDAPFSAWHWEGKSGAYSMIDLCFTNGVWNCLVNAVPPPYTKEGGEKDNPVSLAGLTFIPTNSSDVAYVVYTDTLDSMVNKEMGAYVAKTNLYGLTYKIVEEKLHTIGGIAEILRGIRRELVILAGGSGIHVQLDNITSGTKLVLGSATMKVEGDGVEIDWGDGSEVESVILPASHIYTSDLGSVNIVISGYIKEIAGTSTRDETGPFPFIGFGDNDNSRFQVMVVDPAVQLESLGYAAFYDCDTIGSLTFIPSDIIGIGEYTFAKCDGLANLSGLPVGVTAIPNYAFYNCASLVSVAGIPKAVTSIGEGAFKDCVSLETIVGIPSGCLTIGKEAFAGCTSLKSVAGLPEGLTEIPESCFYGSAITSLSGLPSTVKTFGERAFAGCDSISVVDGLPTSLETIKPYCFSSCKKLESVVIPSTVETLGELAFTGSFVDSTASPYKLTVEFKGRTMEQILEMADFPWAEAAESADIKFVGIDGYLVRSGSSWVPHYYKSTFVMKGVPAGTTMSVGSYVSSKEVLIDWGDGSAVTEATSHTYTADGDYTVLVYGPMSSISATEAKHPWLGTGSGNPYLVSASFSDGVGLESVGDWAFADCSAIETLPTFNSTIVSFGANSFAYCSSLKSLDGIPTTITSLGEGCFRQNFATDSSLTDISALATLTSISAIPAYCFYGCKSIEELSSLPASVSSIGDFAFYNCIKIGEAIIPDTITSFGEKCFYRIGYSATPKTDGTFTYKISISFPGRTYDEVGTLLDLDGKNKTELPIGEDIVMIKCAGDAQLVRNATDKRWEVIKTAIVVNLSDVPRGTTFKVSGSTIPIDQASYVWDWGDGTVEKWLDASPPHGHTYADDGDYTITIKGLVKTIAASSSDYPWIGVQGETSTNPYITGYSVPRSTSPLTTIGNYAFAGCPNLPYVNTLSRSFFRKGAPRNVARESASRLSTLAAQESDTLSLGDHVFAYSGLVDLSAMHSEVTKLPDYTFIGNEKLVSIEGLPDDIVDIGESCFRDCVSLKSLSGYPTYLTYVSSNCFNSCYGLTDLDGLGFRVSAIQDYGFYNCTNITTLYGMPTFLTSIGKGAFSRTGIYDLGYFSPTITNIEDQAFRNCENLTSLVGMPNGVTRIGDESFFGCTNIASLSTLSENVDTIGKYAFYNVINVTNAVLPSSIKSLANTAFTNLGGAKEFQTDEFGNKYQAIVECNSMTCKGLVSVLDGIEDVPLTVKFVCSDGYVINTVDGLEIRENFITIDLSDVPAGTTFKVADVAVAEGHTIDWDWGDGTIEEGISAAPKEHTYAFGGDRLQIRITGRLSYFGAYTNNYPVVNVAGEGNEYLTDFYIGGGVGLTSLGSNSFRGCENIKDLSGLEYSYLTKLGRDCFRDGTGLESISGLPKYLSSAEQGVFANCSSLSDCDALKDTKLSVIPAEMFMGCTNITSLGFLPKTVSALGDMAFKGCVGLRNLNGLPDGLKSFYFECFAGCSNLTSLAGLPKSVSLGGVGAFKDCPYLGDISALRDTELVFIPARFFENCKSITSLSDIPSGVSMYGDESFKGCSGLTSLSGMTTNVTIIGEGCFSGCSSLTSLSGVSPSIVSFPYCAFQNCVLLKNLYGVTTNLLEVGSYCFSGCSSLNDSVVLPTSVKSIGEYCFEDCTSLSSVGVIGKFNGEVLPSGLFKGCTGIKSMDGLPSTIKQFGDYSFSGSGIKSTLDFGDDVSYLGDGCFKGCMGLLHVGSLGGVVEINKALFKNCSNENDTVTIPSGVASIKEEAFSGCVTIQKIIVPKTVAEIAEDAFTDIGLSRKGDTGTTVHFNDVPIRSVYGSYGFPWGAPTKTIFTADDGYIRYDNENEVWALRCVAISADVSNYDKGVTIYPGVITPYESVDPAEVFSFDFDWGDGTVISNITSRPSGKYFPARYLSKIQILGEVESVSADPSTTNNLYKHGGFLYAVSGPSSSGSTLSGAYFEKYTGLHISSSSSLRVLGPYAICNWKALTDLDISESSVAEFGDRCFFWCESLKDAGRMPSTLTTIGKGCFERCYALTNIVFHSGMSSIGYEAFKDVGNNAEEKVDEDGNTYKTVVTFERSTLYDIKVMFGGGTRTTAEVPTHIKFVGSDGYMFNSSQGWKSTTAWMAIHLKGVSAGQTFNFGNVTKNGSGTITVSYGDGQQDTNKSKMPTSHKYLSDGDFVIRISGDIASIEPYDGKCFVWSTTDAMSHIEKVVVGADFPMKSIGAYSFANCPDATDFVFECTNLVTIGEHAFANSNNPDGELNIAIPSSTTEIGAGCFASITNGYVSFDGRKSAEVLKLRTPFDGWGCGETTEFWCDDNAIVYEDGEWKEVELPTMVVDIEGMPLRKEMYIASYKYGVVGYTTNGFQNVKYTFQDIVPDWVYSIGEIIECVEVDSRRDYPYRRSSDTATYSSKMNANSVLSSQLYDAATATGGDTPVVMSDENKSGGDIVSVQDAKGGIAKASSAYTSRSWGSFPYTITYYMTIRIPIRSAIYDLIPQYKWRTVGDTTVSVGPLISSPGSRLKVYWYDENTRNRDEIRSMGVATHTFSPFNGKVALPNGGGWVDYVDPRNAITGRCVIVGKIREIGAPLVETKSTIPGEPGIKVSIAARTGLKKVGDSVFEGGRFEFDGVLPPSVTSIGDRCFYMNDSLTSLDVIAGTQLQEIGERCFEGCVNLTSMDGLPSTVKTMGKHAFAGCAKMPVKFPEGAQVDGIPERCFYGAHSDVDGDVKSVLIPNVGVGDWAFANCKGIWTVRFFSDTQTEETRIGEGAFANCEALTSAVLPKNSYLYDLNVFDGCSNAVVGILGNTTTVKREDGVYGLGTNVPKYLLPDGKMLYPTGAREADLWPCAISNVVSDIAAGQEVTINFQPQSTNSTVLINWGDGNVVALGTRELTENTSVSHTYEEARPGDTQIIVTGFVKSLGSEEEGKHFLEGLHGKNVSVYSDYMTGVTAITNSAFTDSGNLKVFAHNRNIYSTLCDPIYLQHSTKANMPKLEHVSKDAFKNVKDLKFYADANTKREFKAMDGLSNAMWNNWRVTLADCVNATAEEVQNESVGCMTFLVTNAVDDVSFFIDGYRLHHSSQLVNIDWGDGSEDSFSSGTNETGVVDAYIGHEYSGVGRKSALIRIGGAISKIEKKDDGTARPFLQNNIETGKNSLLIESKVDDDVGLGETADYMYYQCTELTELCGGSTITNIGNYSYAGCTSLTNLFAMPTSVKTIGDHAFDGCVQLASLKGISPLVEYVGSGAFNNCNNLREGTFTESFKYMASDALPSFFSAPEGPLFGFRGQNFEKEADRAAFAARKGFPWMDYKRVAGSLLAIRFATEDGWWRYYTAAGGNEKWEKIKDEPEFPE